MNTHNQKPLARQHVTNEQVSEVVKCAADPAYFIETYVKIRGLTITELNDYQNRLIHSFHASNWVITRGQRANGKTLALGAYLLWYLMFNIDKLVLIAASTDMKAKDLLELVRSAYEDLPVWLKAGLVRGQKHELEFDNGSKIVFTRASENLGRGRTISLMVFADMTNVEQRVLERLWQSVVPAFMSYGDCIVMSDGGMNTELFNSLWNGAVSSTNKFVPVDDASEHGVRV